MTRPSRLLDLPELNVAIFSFLLHFVWEMQQMPFFNEPPEWTIWDMTKVYTRATFGDVSIALAAFWTVALFARSREWVLRPTAKQVMLFIAVGVVITIVFEAIATRVLDRWHYAATMPMLPILGTGLSPLLQWVVLPPLVVWFVRRQLT